MLDTQFPQIFICSVLSSTFSRGKGSLLVIRWVRYLGNKPDKTKRIPLGTGKLVHFWLEDEAVALCHESHHVPCSWLGWWNKGCSHYIAQNIQRQSASMVEDRIIIQNDWLEEIREKEISCKITRSSMCYCAWAQSAAQNGQQLGG